jgi:hypothetical protein
MQYAVSVTYKSHVCFQENPLCAFTEFLMECVAKKNFQGSISSLKAFKAGWLNMKINVSLSALYRNYSYILPKL